MPCQLSLSSPKPAAALTLQPQINGGGTSMTVDLVASMGNLGPDALSAEVSGDTVAQFRMAAEHLSR